MKLLYLNVKYQDEDIPFLLRYADSGPANDTAQIRAEDLLIGH